MTDETLTLTASGRIETTTTHDSDAMTVQETTTRDVEAEIALDADALYSGAVATTHQHGVTIPASDVADHVAGELDARAVAPREWDVTVAAPLDNWQKVALAAARKRRGTYESNTIETALDVLETMHERYAETDRPLLAALNIDESYEAGRRAQLLERLADGGGERSETTGADADSAAGAEADAAAGDD